VGQGYFGVAIYLASELAIPAPFSPHLSVSASRGTSRRSGIQKKPAEWRGRWQLFAKYALAKAGAMPSQG